MSSISSSSSSFPPSPAAPFDPSYAVRFTAPSPMALTVTAFLLLLLFVGFFSIFAGRRCFSTLRRATQAVHHRPPPPLLLSTDRYYRRYLTPTVGAAAGLDAWTVRALPVLTYAGGAKEVGGCVVCLGEFEEKDRVKVIPGCGHLFHPDCIDGWLVLHGSCPICRCSHLFAAAAPRNNAGQVWVNLVGADGTHLHENDNEEEEEEEEDSSSTTTSSSGGTEEDGGAHEDRSPEEKRVGLGRSESFRCKGGGGESCCTSFLRRTCSF